MLKKLLLIIVQNFELGGSVVILSRSIPADYYKLITSPLLMNLTR